jgi:aspartyl-tRNA(Asn)/glutamyl-tRNA(Gln) amidotransferase subunit B
MRGKEEAHDYRYFPDPDLPPLVLDPEWIESIRQSLPELPDARRRRWMAEYRLSEVDAALLSEDRAVADYFEELARLSGEPKSSANWVMGEVSRLVNETKMSIDALRVRPSRLRDLMALIRDGVISHSAGKKVFAAMAGTGEDPESAMRRLGLAQVSDAGTLEAEIRRVVEANPDPLNRYLAGNEKLFGFFVGEVMKATKGKANPKRVNEILKKWLDGLQNQE